MHTRTYEIVCIGAIILLVGCDGSRPRAPASTDPGSTSTMEDAPGFRDDLGVFFTSLGVTGLEDGDGAEQRVKLLKAIQLQSQQQDAAAYRLFDEVLADFERKMTDASTIYVSLANRAELAVYQMGQAGKKVVWLDWAFGEALHRKTVLAVIRRDFPEALRLSKRELSFRPCAAVAYTEYGFILNQMGQAKEGLTAYQRALQLAEQFPSSSRLKPAALRGIGFSRIELADYAGARSAFNRSLELEPNNKIALSELQYIDKLEAMAK